MKKIICIICMCLCICLLCSCSANKDITIYENGYGYDLGTEMEKITLEDFIALGKEDSKTFEQKYAKDGIRVVFTDEVEDIYSDLSIELKSGIKLELHNPVNDIKIGKTYEFEGTVKMVTNGDSFVIQPYLYSLIK